MSIRNLTYLTVFCAAVPFFLSGKEASYTVNVPSGGPSVQMKIPSGKPGFNAYAELEFDMTPGEGKILRWEITAEKDGEIDLDLRDGRRLKIAFRETEILGNIYSAEHRKSFRRWQSKNVFTLRTHQVHTRKFAWSPYLSMLADTSNNMPHHTIPGLDLKFSIRFENGRRGQFLFDGFPAGGMEFPEEFFGKNVKMDVKGVLLRKAAEEPEEREKARIVWTQAVTDFRTNASSVAGEKLLTPAKASCGGVPFQFPRKDDTGFSLMDLSRSTVMQVFATDYETVETGLGKRWPAAADGMPFRTQLRVPYAQYDSIEFLAVSDPGMKNAIGRFSVQFYRPYAGFPQTFVSPEVPAMTEAPRVKGSALEVKNEKGETRWLHRISIPLDYTKLEDFADLPFLDFELTRGVEKYMSEPDSWYGSFHAAGLPSSVRIFAVTLRKCAVQTKFEPRSTGGVFAEGEPAEYHVTLTNITNIPQKRDLVFTVRSIDGSDVQELKKSVTVKPGATEKTVFTFQPKRFGHYEVTLNDRTGTPFRRTAAHVRKRVTEPPRPWEAKGFFFGWWYDGQHHILPLIPSLEVGAKVGLETLACSPDFNDEKRYTEEERAAFRKYGYRSFSAADLRNSAKMMPDPDKPGEYTIRPETADEWRKKFEETGIRKKSDVQDPQFANFLAEPGGLGTHGTISDYWGDQWEMTDGEKKMLSAWSAHLRLYNMLFREKYPDFKILLPWGDPLFAVPFLRRNDPDVISQVAGTAYDAPLFGRIPEAQVSQNSTLHRLYILNREWAKVKKNPPQHIAIEGPFISTANEVYLSEREFAGRMIRSAIILGAYGVTKQFSICRIVDCAGWWGEQQYGGCGILGRRNLVNPHLAASTLAALTRHLRSMVFEGADETGSRSTYSVRFREDKTNRLLRTLWTISGKRTVTLRNVTGQAELYDAMDNLIPLTVADGAVSFEISDLPVYFYGADGKDVKIELSEPDHSDMAQAAHRTLLGNAADLFSAEAPFRFRLSDFSKNDETARKVYENSFPAVVRRFRTPMKITKVRENGMDGLAVQLLPPEKDRLLMPYYTELYCNVTIPGVPEALTVNVKGTSDWGRVVWQLRDAKGERFISVGQPSEWNSDDQYNWSFFTFDGRRDVRFVLPRTYPGDGVNGACNFLWGTFGGDRKVDYPLTLEKVYVERRNKLIYLNSLEAASDAAPVLGDVYAEYRSEAEMKEDAVKLYNTRFTEFSEDELTDVAGDLREKGVLPPTEILSVEHPPIQQIDGSRGVFSFREVEGAVTYDIYVSYRPDGRGAMKLASAKKSGVRINGLKPNTDLYAFVVYFDKTRKQSKPSGIFKFHLESLFSQM